MSKKSKILTALASVFCFILGTLVGALGNLILSAPDSYEIPSAVEATHNHVVTGEVNTTTVKNSDLSIHFLELGNKYTGDCTLIKVGNTEMLIDAGSKASSIEHIKAYIDNYCTDGTLEYVVVTHAHEDHYAGFATNENTHSLFDIYKVENIIDFGTGTNKKETPEDNKTSMFENYIRERDAERAAGATYTPIQDFFKAENPAERTFELGTDSGVMVEMLYQKFYEEEAETENDYSVCLQIVYDEKHYLFTGDLEEEGEESLVAENEPGGKNEGLIQKVELYKAGHHGSKTSSTSTLMNVIKPNIVCVCCCAGSSEYTSKNENQFPTQEFVNNVYSANSETKVYVTTLCVNYKANEYTSFNGNIVICTNADESTAVYCSNNTTELRDTNWFKENRTLPTSAA